MSVNAKELLEAGAIAGLPALLSGRVYGTLLNHRSALTDLGDSARRPPYNAPPMAPVLYVKPRNTLALSGDEIVVPRDAEELEIGGCLGLVIDRAATNVGVKAALDYLVGYVIVNDISVPHDSYYRPSIRFKARDGFCPIGPAVTPPTRINDPGSLVVRTFIDGKLASAASLAGLIRPVPQLLADVTEFMTLEAGDVLGVGVAAPAPRARAGQVVRVEIDGLGAIENCLVREAEAP